MCDALMRDYVMQGTYTYLRSQTLCVPASVQCDTRVCWCDAARTMSEACDQQSEERGCRLSTIVAGVLRTAVNTDADFCRTGGGAWPDVADASLRPLESATCSRTCEQYV